MKKDPRYLKEESRKTDTLERVSRLSEVAKDRGQSLAQMSIAWVLKNPAVTSALIGASRPSQITENVESLKHLEFTEEEERRIQEILKQENAS